MTISEMNSLYKSGALIKKAEYERTYERWYGHKHRWKETVTDTIVCFEHDGKCYIYIVYHNSYVTDKNIKEFHSRTTANNYLKKVLTSNQNDTVTAKWKRIL